MTKLMWASPGPRSPRALNLPDYMKGKLRLMLSYSPLLLSFERLAMEFRKKLVFQFVGPSKHSLSFHHSYTDLEFPTNEKQALSLSVKAKS